MNLSLALDARAIEQLAHLHGDIGRFGGLLKLWLSKKSLGKYGESLDDIEQKFYYIGIFI